MQVIVDDLLTNYQRLGQGKKVILLIHGWGDTSKTFIHLMKLFGSNYTLVAIDLPGFGGTQAPTTAWGLEEYAYFVAQCIKKLDLDVFAIVAHSNGAAVAIKGVAHNVLKPKKLILLGAAGIRNRQKIRNTALKVVAKTGKVATFWLPKISKQKLQKKLYGTVGSDLLVVPHMQETFKKTVRQDVQNDARHISIPVLLIYGADDSATPPLYGKIYAQLIGNAQLEIVASAGHFVHQDATENVANKIKEFLQ